MKSDKTRELVELSLYAALIIVSVQFIRIPFGPQFVHMGNALVVIAVLIFGARKGALVATVGLGLFDIFNGYAAEVWITILESLIVCYVLYLVFEKLLKSNDKMANIIIIGVIAPLNWRRSSVAPRSERLLKKTRPRKSGILENLRRSSTRLRLSTLI